MKLLLGDCLDKLKELDDNSVDSIVTDPPYGLAFMGKKWDYDVPSQAIWEECMRVLKPGGHILSFAGSRTYHRMAVRIEDAGFEIRDQIMWIYGSGFPKSHNIGKAVDKLQGNEREVVGDNPNHRGDSQFNNEYTKGLGQDGTITKGNSDWEGWGTALKPAHEPIVMARKPLIGTVADNVLEYGVGGINIDGCRVEYKNEADEKSSIPGSLNSNQNNSLFGMGEGHEHNTQGRFPANIILDEEAGRILDEQSGKSKSSPNKWEGDNNAAIYGKYEKGVRQSTFSDNGGASRFFYCPKASKKDRDEGCDGLPQKANVFMSPDSRMDKEHYERTSPGMERFKTEPKSNFHPTVKPTDLMAYLVRLVTPKGGVVLDPFMGSGSTGKACVREGMNFIGIEREEEYMEIAKSRIEAEQKKNKYQQFWEV
jgi:site-specific DNA-methyltransferase (adenine-specific)